ncbi:MAG TPA: hypothetical protein PLI79_01465 [Mycobacterium sp.]|nr:hypothetical protein [Mycobacterium sp.]
MTLEDSWAEAVAHHRAGVKDVLLAEYRCRKRGCLLLHVWQSPNGLEFFAPASSVSGRFTSAGQWHWLGMNRSRDNKTGDRAGRIDDLAEMLQAGGWLWLLCEHVKVALWVKDIRADAAGGKPGEPVKVFLPRHAGDAATSH